MVTGLIAAGIGAAGGLASSAMGYYQSKKMAAYNSQLQYNNQLRGYKQFPSAQVEGLRRAGINPMVAYGGIAGADAHTSPGPAMSGPNLSNLGDSFTRGRDSDTGKKQANTAERIGESQIEANSAMAEKSRAEGRAAIMNAETNAKNANTNAISVGKQAPNDPNNSGWAVGKYLTDGLGGLVGSAFGAKYLYDWFKGKGKGKTPTSVVPKNAPATSNAVNAAKQVAPFIAKTAVKAAAAAGTVKAMKKAQKTVKEDKKSNYNQQPYHRRLPNAFGIPNYW